LEKLRKIFTKRGVTLSALVIAGAVSANSVQAAPVGLAKTISVVVIAKGAAAGSSTLTLVKGALKIMAWTKAKMAVVVTASVLLAAGTATTVTVLMKHPSPSSQEAQAIVDRVGNKYFGLQTYSSTGTTMEEIDGKTLIGSFSMRLGRTNLYRVEYDFHGSGLTNKGAAWSDGTGDYFANDMVPKITKWPVEWRIIWAAFGTYLVVRRSSCQPCSSPPIFLMRLKQAGCLGCMTQQNGRMRTW
ncbi:MAG: hypothetical protein ABJC04_09180, partial [Verrucomicrobiota bacterium]